MNSAGAVRHGRIPRLQSGNHSVFIFRIFRGGNSLDVAHNSHVEVRRYSRFNEERSQTKKNQQ
jgi:hypothetical protein